MDGASDLGGDAGGSVGREEIETAAVISLAGINPMSWFANRDLLDADFMVATANRAQELRALEREEQAVLIANKVGEMLSG